MEEYVSLTSLTSMSPQLFFLLVVWAMAWKGFALWKAANKKHLAWFIILFIINTFGILEILYFYIFSELDNQSKIKSGKIKTTYAKRNNKKRKKKNKKE